VCKNPISGERIESDSRPDEPLYLLKCEGASYRVRLIPDRAAEYSMSRTLVTKWRRDRDKGLSFGGR
jgi:hypothetical protein